jgi:capsular polysaccharide transport system ATP-binding protein
MIKLQAVSKHYRIAQGLQRVIESLDLTINRGEKIGILGRNGAGKSTLIRLISGAELPSRGRVLRSMSASWPLAFGGAFQGSLTGMDNLKFIFRVYGLDYRKRIAYIEDFAELGKYFCEPVKTYSSGMRSRLAFAISLAIEFDCFLIDEVISVGDTRFHEKCKYELFEQRKDRAMVMVSHEAHNIREHCNKAFVLHLGKLTEFEDVETAYIHYNQYCQTSIK